MVFGFFMTLIIMLVLGVGLIEKGSGYFTNALDENMGRILIIYSIVQMALVFIYVLC